MTLSQMPYQCMVRSGKLLFAARGSSIDTLSLEKGAILSTWMCSPIQQHQRVKATTQAMETTKAAPGIAETAESAPPAKRRKLSPASVDKTEQPSHCVDIETTKAENGNEAKGKKGNQKQNDRLYAIANGLETPAIVALDVTQSGQHVIAVTGDDKSIRVFENKTRIFEGFERPILEQISIRAMPKRPCAIKLSSDSNTIISADKFGDVYSVPLLYVQPDLDLSPGTQLAEPAPANTFVPSANELTIHSQRNRKALEAQRKQAKLLTETAFKKKEKLEPTFEHTLLLGHVSMLTDLALVTLQGKNYILTADRDEHIRVSRGIPQSHAIENFCMGHTDFITRLCVPKNRPGTLISGGGEDDLLVWEWSSGRLVSKIKLKTYVTSVPSKESNSGKDVHGLENEVRSKIVVSGIYHTSQPVGPESRDFVIVTCEGVSAVFLFALGPKLQLAHVQTLETPGNALVVATDIASPGNESAPNSRLLVSVDTIHECGSTTEIRESLALNSHPLVLFDFKNGAWESSGFEFGLAGGENETYDGIVTDKAKITHLSNLLYNLENLRKREGDRDET